MAPPARRIGLLFGGAPRVPRMVELAQQAERAGFESVWMAETRMTRDGFTPLAAIALATERIGLGTGIVNVYTRGAVVMAVSFATLAEIAPGRVIVGLGPGSPRVLAPQGYSWSKPLTRLREYTQVMGPLLRGEDVTFAGEAVSLQGARIEDVLAGNTSEIGDEANLPIYFGVTGSAAVELAGELADGVLYNVCLPIEYLARARQAIERGAGRAGRAASGVDIAMVILTSADADSEVGKCRAHAFCSLYLSLFPNIAVETGVDPDVIAETREAFHGHGLEAAQRVLPLNVVDRLCAAGTPAECQSRLDEYRAAGVNLPVISALEGSIELAIETLR